MKNKQVEVLRTNAKQQTKMAQYGIRKSIVRLLQSGMIASEVAKTLDVSRAHVYAVKKKYEEKGIAGIKPGKRGRRSGEKRTLTPEQEKEIQHIIVDKTPDQLRFKECLWTRNHIRGLIQEK